MSDRLSTVHPSAATGFGQHADLYHAARPDYPLALAEWIREQLQLDSSSQVMDLGAGTGKFIPILLQLAPHVTAVEPVAAMLEQLRARFAEVTTLQACSQHLPVPSNQLDAVFCAQSFHWFADALSVAEMARVLRTDGHLVLIWNQRDVTVDWVKALDDLINELEGDTPRYHRGVWQQVLQGSAFVLHHHHQISHPHCGTVQQVVIDRCLSTSFIAALADSRRQALAHLLADLVFQYTGLTAADPIAMPYVTHVYHYQKMSPSPVTTG